jgi:hypothetical protein
VTITPGRLTLGAPRHAQAEVGEEAEEAERDREAADDQGVADREVGQLQRTASDAFVT